MLFPYQKDKWKWQGRQYPQSPSLMPPTIGHVGEGDEWKAQWRYPDAHITSESGPLQQSPIIPGANQAQTPTAPFGGGIGKNAYQGAGLSTKKKGLSMKNMINAMSKLKSPTGEDFGRAGGRAGGPRPTAPSPRALGVDALEMASADDPRKKWWKQWQGLMGA